MKVSKEKKEEIRNDLLQAAVDVFTEKGFKAATMREISTRAGYGAATIYNYFPTKDKILYAYFNVKLTEAVDTVKNIPDLEAYTLKEKLQILLETALDIYLQDREFVREAYQLLFDSPLKTFTELEDIHIVVTEMIKSFLNEAEEKKEIPVSPFDRFVAALYDEYCILIVMFWLRDESEDFSNTTQLIDMTLDLFVGILKSGLITKFVEIIVFLLKSFIYSRLENVHKIFSTLKGFQEKYLNS